MAIKTPARPTHPLTHDREDWHPIETSPTTTSRAVRPPVVVEHRHLSRKDVGEAHLVWRCDDCGETGTLTAFPTACPACGARRETLYYYTED